ncbi:uncharacterized protein LOC115343664 isoform X6 [Aquila chrysaetos chrysaetos]|uniref:uncharacterized protein LOC115343664 isoform X6 n=1 Tax=Aquila chrysaetos chrysaetos TaxID=223781 RepID=UPI00117719BA|nr:uncharacterized protein LOC115343664 isoform X6 [Aquila chrysaetos chrysaetos]
MRKPPASGVASKTRLPRQSIIATPLMYLGHKKWFTGAGAGLRNAARPIDGQAVGGQHPLRPVLNTSARFCPGVPGIPGHFLKISPKSAVKQLQAELGILAYAPTLEKLPLVIAGARRPALARAGWIQLPDREKHEDSAANKSNTLNFG